jgi:hypothetical protein
MIPAQFAEDRMRRFVEGMDRGQGTLFAAEMALHVLAYNLTRVMNIIGVRPLLGAMRA